MEAIGFSVLWYAFSLVAAVAAWPLVGKAFPESIAWGATRLVAVPLVGYLVALPAALAPTPFTSTRIWLTTAVLAVVSWSLAAWKRAFRPRTTKSEVLAFEGALLGAYFLFALIVPYYASVSGMGERMRDAALWTAMVTQQRFPFEEPWFAGTTVVYYVFGYATQAVSAIAWGDLEPLRSYDIALVQCAAWFVAASFLAFRAFRATMAVSLFGAAASALAGNAYAAVSAGKALLTGVAFNWWNPSRTIENTITEFPIWTATLGDLHPHFLGMWIFPLLVAVLGAAEDDDRPWWVLVVVAAALTALQHGTNTWELPVFVCLVVLAIIVKLRTTPKEKVVGVGLYLVTIAALAFPFARYSAKVSRAFGFVQVRSDVWEWLGHWGLWVIPFALACFFRVRKDLGRDLVAGFAVIAALALGFRSATVFMILVIALLAYTFAANRIEAERRWLVALWAYGLVVVLGCEFLHLQDVYGEELARLNTVFKFYVPAWTALAIPSILLTAEALRGISSPWNRILWIPWVVGLLAYPTVGLWSRTHGFASRDSLDGLDELRREMPDDVRLIQWMRQERVAGRLQGKLLEAPGNAYSTAMRFASTIGMPALVAWDGYGYWSIQGLSSVAGERMILAKEVYSGRSSCEEARSRLAAFGITHLVVAKRERDVYPADRIAYLEECFALVHREGAAALYAL